MTQPIVQTTDVVKTFGKVRALDGVSLEFEPGIIYGLLGPNGAGKTTLIRVLTTLLKPDSGVARVGGVDVVTDPRSARDMIGLAGQAAAVDEYLTGRENVEMIGRLYNLSARESKTRTDEILERIHLQDAADRPVRTYSGGMRRRLDVAASMVGRPRVLFLDEPTTGIDPRSRIDIWDLIHDLIDGGTTILLTTQYLDEADQLAARIGVIDQGRLITEGTADELKDKVGGSVVQLAIADDHRAAAAQVLHEVSGAEPSLDERTGRLSIPASSGASTMIAVARRLDAAGLVPDDFSLRKPTLDDVFLALTGHAAETSSTEPSGRAASAGVRRRAR
jgi:ABC-2 type transport system ATP-binding protein